MLRHSKPQPPKTYFKESLAHFKRTRKDQGLSTAEIEEQMHHAMGVILRGAAARPPNEFAQYIAECVQR